MVFEAADVSEELLLRNQEARAAFIQLMPGSEPFLEGLFADFRVLQLITLHIFFNFRTLLGGAFGEGRIIGLLELELVLKQ